MGNSLEDILSSRYTGATAFHAAERQVDLGTDTGQVVVAETDLGGESILRWCHTVRCVTDQG